MTVIKLSKKFPGDKERLDLINDVIVNNVPNFLEEKDVIP